MKLVGYISISKDGEPLRKPRSGYGFHTQDQKGYHPPRIYQTPGQAKRQSPIGVYSEVYIKDTTEQTKD